MGQLESKSRCCTFESGSPLARCTLTQDDATDLGTEAVQGLEPEPEPEHPASQHQRHQAPQGACIVEPGLESESSPTVSAAAETLGAAGDDMGEDTLLRGTSFVSRSPTPVLPHRNVHPPALPPRDDHTTVQAGPRIQSTLAEEAVPVSACVFVAGEDNSADTATKTATPPGEFVGARTQNVSASHSALVNEAVPPPVPPRRSKVQEDRLRSSEHDMSDEPAAHTSHSQAYCRCVSPRPR